MRVIITQAQRLEVWNLRWGRPHFLQKDDVSVLRGQPRRHTFGNRAADAVEAVGRVFSRFDADGDGFIDAEELSTVCALTGVTAWRALKEIDADQDGRISRAEFLRWWTRDSSRVAVDSWADGRCGMSPPLVQRISARRVGSRARCRWATGEGWLVAMVAEAEPGCCLFSICTIASFSWVEEVGGCILCAPIGPGA